MGVKQIIVTCNKMNSIKSPYTKDRCKDMLSLSVKFLAGRDGSQNASSREGGEKSDHVSEKDDEDKEKDNPKEGIKEEENIIKAVVDKVGFKSCFENFEEGQKKGEIGLYTQKPV